MKKLSLDVAELKVDSFETYVPEEQRGTVRGAGSCPTYSCPPGTCGASPPSDSWAAKMAVWSQTNCPICCV
ncbi:MAG TPA: pinensin family lanthipeptide [Longimicrobium sp.]|nr:pinensin family lanthipeptide [Longimicrobium sp.]